jgi:two-component system response regulator RegA
MPAPRRVLIVEDDVDLAQAIARSVRALDPEAGIAQTLAQALRMLTPVPHLIVCDVRLPDGSGVAVAEAAAQLRPFPAVVAISGAATAEEAFALARHGVRGYLQKPLSLPDLRQTIERVLAEPLPFEPVVATLVGHREIQDVQGDVRRIMVEQALAMAGGDRADAASLLEAARTHIRIVATRDRG